MIKALIRIIFLGAALVLASCDQTSLPEVTMLPAAVSNSRASSASPSEEDDAFAATGAECGIDRREVATMVYLPIGADLGEGSSAVSCCERPPGFATRNFTSSSGPFPVR